MQSVDWNPNFLMPVTLSHLIAKMRARGSRKTTNASRRSTRSLQQMVRRMTQKNVAGAYDYKGFKCGLDGKTPTSLSCGAAMNSVGNTADIFPPMSAVGTLRFAPPYARCNIEFRVRGGHALTVS
jgi:hypothetical protein